ncbi:hypothetical protein [Paenibacillus medicaginis]|uniref:Tail fiber protein n=1 Tax=Paenibacillus medicaginis TaxID=1470560 RepID=A0ABV5C736_9BACL
MSENTQQLNLLMKDPTLDGHEYFNVKTMMNDNWEKIDKFAGEAKANIENLEGRLNSRTEEEVVLNGGVQIVDAVKAAPFNLTGLKGRTLVNLLGRWGGMESLIGVLGYQATVSLDTTNKTQGSSGLKVTLASGYSSGAGYYSSLKLTAGKYYVGIANVKNGNASTGATISFPSIGAGPWITDASKFQPVFLKVNPTTDVTTNVDVAIKGSAGQYAYFDEIRVYEISAAEYADLPGMTAAQVAAKYPYVDSVTPVRNPYVIRYGENLLPPFYEWSGVSAAKVNGPYEESITVASGATGNTTIIHTMPAVPGTTYTFSCERTGSGLLGFDFLNAERDTVLLTTGFIDAPATTLTAPAGAGYMRTWTVAPPTAGTYTYKNPMLNIGSKPLPFVPREDAMLALQTDLYADPVTGANADSVFEQGGQYFKAKKWQRLVLDGSQNWMWSVWSTTGYKRVQPNVGGNYEVLNNPVNESGWLVKYDGKLLTRAASGTVQSAGDQQIVTGIYNNAVYNAFNLTVSNTDSGWGDNYTPTSDEIKAYFMGWVMYDGSLVGGAASPNNPAGNTYNGTGSKAWCYRTDGVSRTYAGPTATLPTTQAPVWTPYGLVYQLATPTVEPIVSEGQLTFNEGSNQVEVGTGIVLREAVKVEPYYDYNPNANRWAINRLSGSRPNPLKNKPIKIMVVYGNSMPEAFNWGVTSLNDGNWYGNVYIDQIYAYSSDKAYSVTYLMSATSPTQPVTGTYAGNEKSLLEDLVDSVTQQEIRLAVVENKKSEKDNPAWITPTLLNGWTSPAWKQISYYKDSEGVVRFRGAILGGVITGNAHIIQLPVGFRPTIYQQFAAITISSSSGAMLGRVVVDSQGRVFVDFGSNTEVSLDTVAFRADL